MRKILTLALFMFALLGLSADAKEKEIERTTRDGCEDDKGWYDFVDRYEDALLNKIIIECRYCGSKWCPTESIAPTQQEMEVWNFVYAEIDRGLLTGFRMFPSGWSVSWQSDNTNMRNSTILIQTPETPLE